MALRDSSPKSHHRGSDHRSARRPEKARIIVIGPLQPDQDGEGGRVILHQPDAVGEEGLEEADRIQLRGELTFATVPFLFSELQPLTSRPLNVDLSGLERIDSAGLALLVEWFRIARSRRVPLKYHRLPQQFWPMVVLYDLETVLPLEKTETAHLGSTEPPR